MLKVLQSKLGESIDEKDVIVRSYLKESDWPPKLYDFDYDSRQLIEQAETKRAKKMNDRKMALLVSSSDDDDSEED